MEIGPAETAGLSGPLLVRRLSTGPYAAIAAAPFLPPGGKGSVGLDVVLEHSPQPDEGNVAGLIRRGRLTLGASVLVDARDRERAAHRLGTPVENLYSVGGVGELVDVAGSTPHLLATAPLSSRHEALFEAHLGPAETRRALEAFYGAESSLFVRVRIDHRDDPSETAVSIDGLWVDIYDRLAAGAEVAGRVTRSDFEAQVIAALHGGELTISADPPMPIGEAESVAITMMLGQRPALFDPSREESDDCWLLRPRPWPSQRISLTERRVVGTVASVEVSQALTDFLDAGEERRRDAVRLLAESASGEVVPVARRSRAKRPGPAKAFVDLGAGLTTPGELVGGRQGPRGGTALLKDGSPSFLVAGQLANWAEILSTTIAPSGPVISDVDAPSFADHSDEATRWWAPRFRLAAGATTANSDDDRFRFEFRRLGAGADGAPVLEATVALTIEPFQAPASIAAVEGVARSRRVEVDDVVVSLEVPFIDATDGATKHHQLVGTVTETDSAFLLTFEVGNEWVRLVYGALARPGFQSEPPALRVAYTFPGYKDTKKLDLSALLATHHFTTKLEPVVTERGVSAFGRDGLVVSIDRKDPTTAAALVSRPFAASHLTAVRPVDVGPVRPIDVVNPERPSRELVKTVFARRMRTELEISCEDVPNRFVDATEGRRAIGCRDNMSLGQIDYRRLRERTALAEEGFRVFQEPAQPHRYVMAADHWRISRREPEGTPEDYRPTAVVYAALDPDPDNVRVAVEFLLQPDVRPYQRRELLGRIRAEHPHAEVVWPTDLLGTQIEFDWIALDTLTSEHTTTALPGGRISVGVKVDVPQWTLFHAALGSTPPQGSMTVHLDDGTDLEAGLDLDPRRSRGPLLTGPIAAETAGGRTTLTNELTTDVNVDALRGYDVDNRLVASTLVGATLGAGESKVVDTPAGVSLEPVYSVPPADEADLTEIRAFVEETEAQALFSLLVDLGAEGLDFVVVEAGFVELDEFREVTLSDDHPSAEAIFVLPLTRGLESLAIRYRIAATAGSGPVSTPGPWKHHDLGASALIHIDRSDLFDE